MVARVLATDKAVALIRQLQQEHGELMFHQSGGCCDGSQPMCFAKNEFKIGQSDVCLGSVADCQFWMSKDQFQYWQHTQLTLDTTQGRGSSFSLEIPLGLRFIIHSRIFTDAEIGELSDLTYLEE